MGAAAVAALAALVGMIALVVHIRANESGIGHLNFASTTRARDPFADFGESRVAVGSRCLRVLVASTPGQRGQGLRDVTALAPYDGMLFVNPSDTNDHYTMANTPTELDITFFSAKGVPVDETRMTPCPHGSDATCPEYASKAPYRYALERPASSSPASGSLGACA